MITGVDRRHTAIPDGDDDARNPMSDKDRIPSEIFEIVSALQEDGTQADRLARRKRALEALLLLMLEAGDSGPSWTLYDHLAISAWRTGIIPPKKMRGRTGTHHDKSAVAALRKAQFRKFYRDLAKTDPHLSSAERLEIIAERFNLDLEWLSNVVRSSRKTIQKALPDPIVFPDILDMWLEWESGRRK